MPIRFKEVVPNLLYRGGAPKPWEVEALKKIFNIKQIISLDEQAANAIKDACVNNAIIQIVIPIEKGKNDASIILNRINPTDIIKDIPTYVHCYHGKDRTGLFVAKYRIENGWTPNDALNEAYSFGFGEGVDPDVVKNYIELIMGTTGEPISNKTCMVCGMKLIRNICIHGCDEEKDMFINKVPTVVSESRDEPYAYNGIDELGDNRMVSDMYNVDSKNMALASYFRQNIIKYLAKKEIKKAYDNRISFKVPPNEKNQAKAAIKQIQDLIDIYLRKYIDHLDLMYEPFSAHRGITPEQASEASLHIDNFSDVSVENLLTCKKTVIDLIKSIEKFDSDSNVYSMLNSIDDHVNTIDTLQSTLVDVLGEKESDDFQDSVVNTIESIKKEVEQLKQLLSETVVNFLRENVLMENWSTEIKDEIEETEDEIEEKPYIDYEAPQTDSIEGEKQIEIDESP